MTDEEIEKALKDLTSIDLSDESNYDSCGRIIAPRGMSVIYEALHYINRLKAEKAQVRKDTAKEIFQTILDDYRGVDYYSFLFEGLQAIADDKYRIRIILSENGVSVEVDE